MQMPPVMHRGVPVGVMVKVLVGSGVSVGVRVGVAVCVGLIVRLGVGVGSGVCVTHWPCEQLESTNSAQPGAQPPSGAGPQVPCSSH